MRLILTLLATLVSLGPGLLKVTGNPRMRASAQHFGIPWQRYRLIGVLELAAAAGLLLGLAVPALGVAAALGMLLLLIGALVVHRRAGASSAEAAPALIGATVMAAFLVLAN